MISFSKLYPIYWLPVPGKPNTVKSLPAHRRSSMLTDFYLRDFGPHCYIAGDGKSLDCGVCPVCDQECQPTERFAPWRLCRQCGRIFVMSTSCTVQEMRRFVERMQDRQ